MAESAAVLQLQVAEVQAVLDMLLVRVVEEAKPVEGKSKFLVA